jgi:hypothetical protein
VRLKAGFVCDRDTGTFARSPSEISHKAHRKSAIWGMTNHPENGYTYSVRSDGPESGVVRTDRLCMLDWEMREPSSLGTMQGAGYSPERTGDVG